MANNCISPFSAASFELRHRCTIENSSWQKSQSKHGIARQFHIYIVLPI